MVMMNPVFNFRFNLREVNLNTPKNMGERIKLARGRMTQKDLSDAIGISQNALSNYENGKRIPKTDFLPKLCSVLGISHKWLLEGEGEMRPDRESTQHRREDADTTSYQVVYAAQDGEDLINVPLVAARLSAGPGSHQVNSDVEDYFAFSSAFLHRKGNPQRMVVMRVEGDSMSPEIRDEDLVLIDQSQTDIRLGRIFAVGFEDAIYLKRIDKLPGKILLKSVNPDYAPVEISTEGQEAESFRVIGQVLWVGREY